MQKYISFYFPEMATVGVPRLLISCVPKSKGLLHLPTHPLPNNCCHSSPTIAKFLILLFASLSFPSIENCTFVLALNSKYNKTHLNFLNVTVLLPLPACLFQAFRTGWICKYSAAFCVVKVFLELCVCTSSSRHGLHHQTQQHNHCKALKMHKTTPRQMVGPPERAALSLDILVSLELKVSLKSLK